MSQPPTDSDIRRAIEAEVDKRGPDKTCCPSDIARALAEDWRPLMTRVRACAVAMAQAQAIDITQGGRVIDASSAVGPIRLRLRSDAPRRRG